MVAATGVCTASVASSLGLRTVLSSAIALHVAGKRNSTCPKFKGALFVSNVFRESNAGTDV